MRLTVGSIICLIAVVLLASGGWALWKDLFDRDSSGMLSTGSLSLDTETYAIVGELRGDGPDWLYGATVFGEGRVRATSEEGESLFIGIARDEDIADYFAGAGYATIQNFATSARTTHHGSAPAHPPAHLSIWATSAEGTGEQTVRWEPRDGDWSVVLMNADASAGVDVTGDLSAEFPPLTWLALGVLIVGGVIGIVGGVLLFSGARARNSNAL